MQTDPFRVEIIANQSVQEELAEAIEAADGPLFYTFLPAVQGRGRQQKKLGNDTWPELNCIYILYTDTRGLAALKEIVGDLKSRFPREGIKLFVVPALPQEF